MSISDVVNAEVDSLEASAALYDARFARTMLFAIGLLIGSLGAWSGIAPAVGLGSVAVASGWYFQALQIPRLEKDLVRARRALGVALGRLGQNLPVE